MRPKCGKGVTTGRRPAGRVLSQAPRLEDGSPFRRGTQDDGHRNREDSPYRSHVQVWPWGHKPVSDASANRPVPQRPIHRGHSDSSRKESERIRPDALVRNPDQSFLPATGIHTAGRGDTRTRQPGQVSRKKICPAFRRRHQSADTKASIMRNKVPCQSHSRPDTVVPDRAKTRVQNRRRNFFGKVQKVLT